MANDILKYTSKDFDSIKTDLIDSISALTATWTSREDGDPGIVLVKHMSAIGDMLSYNLDKQALECYGPTVTQRKNAAKLFELVGYQMHWYRSAVTSVTLTYTPRVSMYLSLMLKAKNCFDLEDISGLQDAYFEYRKNYSIDSNFDISGGNPNSLLFPPPSENPPAYFDDVTGEIDVMAPVTGDIHGEIYRTLSDVPADGSFEDIKTTSAFSSNAKKFADISKDIIEKYQKQKENTLGIHTYIEDTEKQLDIYPNNYGNITYSLIPTTESPDISNGVYEPTVTLEPFVPTRLKAIQGNLKSVNFDISQIQNNRFYLPDFEIDEENIFLLFNTTLGGTTQTQPAIVLYKTNNLLVEDDIKVNSEDIQDGAQKWDMLKVYFQFRVDDFDYPYIELSSYWNSVLPETGKFTLYYFKTRGKYGNITKNFLKRVGTYNSSSVIVENVDTNISEYDESGFLLSRPGSNPETARDAYINSLNYIMTFNSLVTIFDFERFTKRQDGITNALAIDKQRMLDLNDKLRIECESYTEEQLRSILGNVSENETKSVMETMLFNIRKVTNTRNNGLPYAPVTVNEARNVQEQGDSFQPYTLNMYPIYGDFKDYQDSDMNVKIARTSTLRGDNTPLPYRLYGLVEDGGTNPEYSSAVWKGIEDGFARVHIVSVSPGCFFARVFDWKCCGTLHLTKAVSRNEANSIIKKVIDTLKVTFNASNVEFGKRITQMDVIQAVSESDSRIRYFDAGIGDKKVIVYDNIVDSSSYFNIEAYFNAESIMHYNQKIEENLLRIDPMYIQD